MDDIESIVLETREDCQNAAKALILGTVGRLYLRTQSLETSLYHNHPIYQHLSQLTSQNRNTDIRIIAKDTRLASSRGHYLIHLAQKLPSFVQIRIAETPVQRNFNESWLIADDSAYMRIRSPDRYEGNYELDNPLECRLLTESFKEAWEACVPDQNTRRLSL